MSTLKLEDFLNENRDYIEFGNKKYELDVSIQALINYNTLIQKYQLVTFRTKEDTEKLGVDLLNLVFIDKEKAVNDLEEFTKDFPIKKREIIIKKIFDTWLNLLGTSEKDENLEQKKNK